MLFWQRCWGRERERASLLEAGETETKAPAADVTHLGLKSVREPQFANKRLQSAEREEAQSPGGAVRDSPNSPRAGYL